MKSKSMQTKQLTGSCFFVSCRGLWRQVRYMKIPKKLQRPVGEGSLVIVANKQLTRLYYLSKKEIIRSCSIIIDTPRYSDKPGVLDSRSRGGVARTGSVIRPIQRAIDMYFKQSLKKQIEVIDHESPIKKLYLLCSKESKHLLKQVIPKRLRKEIVFERTGNFSRRTPLSIIKNIQEKTKPQPLSGRS